MNKKTNIFLSLFIMSIFALNVTNSFADDDSVNQTRESKSGYERNKQENHKNQFNINYFFKSELTDAEKEKIKLILDENKIKVQTLMTTYSSGVTDTNKSEILSSLSEIHSNLYSNLISFIDTEKVEEFKTFIESKKTDLNILNKKESNKMGKKLLDNNQFNKSNKELKYIKGTVYTEVLEKLNKLSSENLNILNEKLDKLILNSNENSTKLGLYKELKNMVGGVINSLETNSVIEELLNN